VTAAVPVGEQQRLAYPLRVETVFYVDAGWTRAELLAHLLAGFLAEVPAVIRMVQAAATDG
jgi:hypothetical protein